LGDHFFRRGQYYRAIGTYEELALFDPRPSAKLVARLRIATAYHSAGQLESSIAVYNELLHGHHLEPVVDTEVRIQRAVARGELSLALGDFDGAAFSIDELQVLSSDPTPAASWAGYHVARLYLKADHRERKGIPLAGLDLSCGKQDEPPCAQVERLRAVLRMPGPRSRSPAVGLLASALVPGLGSVYAEHYVDGIYSFAFTVGFSGLAYDVFEPRRALLDQKASFYVLGVTGLFFYVANVIRGYLDSARFNEAELFRVKQRVSDVVPADLPLAPQPVAPPNASSSFN
jgi:tetratricopeptide (TPR) repeat protein